MTGESTDRALQPGERMGSLRVLQHVHDGCYGVLYRAEDSESRQSVALRILPTAGGHAALQNLQSLAAHVQALQKLALPLVPLPLQSGTTRAGHAYLTTEWIEGQPLAFHLPRLGPGELLAILQGLAGCLDAAHRHGVHHLLLRPSQVLLRAMPDGTLRPALLGLGWYQLLGDRRPALAAAARAALAPEQQSGGGIPALPAAADVYGFASLIRAWLERPMAGGTAAPWGRGPQRNQALAQALGGLVHAMQGADPATRPTMSEVNTRLYALLTSGDFSGQRSARDNLTLVPATLSGIKDARAAGSPQGRESANAGDPLVGQCFGSFRLLRLLGKGAMGAVYEARHVVIGTRAAVKVLRRQLTAGMGGHEYVKRFLDEARAVNIIEHPGVVSIFEFGQRVEDDLLYIVMEYLPGDTLESLLARRQHPLSLREALPIAMQAAQALAAAHECGIVHRDIKPSNLMLLAEPLAPDTLRVKIVDFGIAKLGPESTREGDPEREDQTEAGAVMGTYAYMAPEQYGDASRVSGKADTFALGVLIYEMLTLRSPFGEANSFSVVGKKAQALPTHGRSAQSSPRLAQLLAQMMEGEAPLRPDMPQVIAVLREELLQIQRPQRRRDPLLLLAGLLSLLVIGGLVIGGLVYVASQPKRPDERRRAAVREQARRLLEGILIAPRTDPALRAEAARALGRSRDPRYFDLLMRQLSDGSEVVQQGTLLALSELGDSRAVTPLRERLRAGQRSGRVADHEWWALLCVLSLQRGQAEPLNSTERELIDIFQKSPQLLADTQPAWGRRLALQTALYLRTAPEQRRPLRPSLLGLLAARQISPPERLRALHSLAEGLDDDWPELREPLEQIARLRDAPEHALQAMAQLRRAQALRPEQEAWAESFVQQHVEYRGVVARQNVALAGLTTDCELLRGVVADRERSELERKQAADSVAFCPFEHLEPLSDLLAEKSPASPTVRVTLAGSLLRALGRPAEQIAEQSSSLDAAVAGLWGTDRIGAIELAAQGPGEDGKRWLLAGLRDQDPRVRDASSRLLSAQSLLPRLRWMRDALLDANTDAQVAGMKAVVYLLDALQQQGQSAPEQEAAALRERVLSLLSQSRDEVAQGVARTLLYWLGDSRQKRALEQTLTSGTSVAKRVLIELLSPRDSLLLRALQDADPRVRFFAARRLSDGGRKEGIAVLREMLAREGEESLIAYWLLRRLGQDEAPPRHLIDMLGRSYPAYVRVHVVQILGALPGAPAIHELERAGRDLSGVVRRQVARVAAELWSRTRAPRLLDLLDRLQSDEDVSVRMYAQRLRAGLHASVATKRAEVGQPPATEPPSSPRADLGARQDPPSAAQDPPRPQPAVGTSGTRPTRTPSELERVEEAQRLAAVSATRSEGIQRLRQIADLRRCQGSAAMRACSLLGELLLADDAMADRALGLNYLKRRWSAAASLQNSSGGLSRTEAWRRFGGKLSWLTIRRPRADRSCQTVHDELHLPQPEMSVLQLSPERFQLRAGEHFIRDCCQASEQHMVSCRHFVSLLSAGVGAVRK
ncbi:MAG: protein kinase [Myxococcales bacterium]|nr:protein kinase [Myxococcales bacterium]